MNKIFALIMGLLIAASPVLAAEELATTLPEPGILPDSPLYGIKKGFEAVEGAFKFTEMTKAEHKIKLAEKRLAESQAMSEKGEDEVAAELVQEYEMNMEQAQERIEASVAKGQNVTDLVERVTARREKHMAILQRVYDNAPESAKAGLQNAINNAEQSTERIMEHVEAKVQAKETNGNESQNGNMETNTEENQGTTENQEQNNEENGEGNGSNGNSGSDNSNPVEPETDDIV